MSKKNKTFKSPTERRLGHVAVLMYPCMYVSIRAPILNKYLYVTRGGYYFELTHYKLAKMNLRHREATKLRRSSPMKAVYVLN